MLTNYQCITDIKQVYIIHIKISNNTILVNNQCITDIKQVYIIHIKISNNTILANNQQGRIYGK